jgi:hypothetical protein
MAKNDEESGEKALPPALQLDWEDLPALAPREHEFFQRIMRGEDVEAAFRASCASHSFDITNWATAKVWKAAQRLRRDVRIETCLAAAYANGAGAGTLTRESHMRELERIREQCRDRGNMAVALQAEMARGKVAGLYVEKIEDVTPFDPLQLLRRMAAIAPEFARAKAAELNIPWEHIEGKAAPLKITAPDATDVATDDATV